MAGWVTLVSLSASISPPNMISVIEKPNSAFALLNLSLASGCWSYKVFAHANKLGALPREHCYIHALIFS
jgi:hypothetical protein